ncbi:MAG: aminotransferase [Rubrimonas sp.]|uniref:aminotransferase n=1 Tax=Rubrimonas sp. TaxID=2036015 RepID=UPI002FDEE069
MAMDGGPLSNMQTRDVEALLHPYTNAVAHRRVGPHVIERGEGVHVYDEHGNRFIEGMAGLWCAGLGFGDAELIEAAREQLGRLPYYHLFGGRSFEPAVELAEKLKDLAPAPMSKVFYQSSGSEANESQIKMAWYYNNARGKTVKKKIVSRQKGYHGVSIFSASLTGLPYNHKDFDLPVSDRVKHVGCPHHWRFAEPGESERDFAARLAAELDAFIEAEGPDTVAAFIAEPVMGAGGVIVPPEGYFEAVMPVLEKHDVLMIDDEVICGFGRTGNWFGATTLGMRPTSISVAKQLTGAYVPLSAVMINGEMAEAIEANSGKIGVFGHGFTYGGHPLGCAVAVKTLEIYERRDIVGQVRAKTPLFQELLRSFADHPLVGEARGIGLMGALELSPDKKTAAAFAEPGKVGPKLAQELLARGVILRAIGDSVAACPPMIITEDEIREMFAPMEEALDATLAWAKAEGRMG